MRCTGYRSITAAVMSFTYSSIGIGISIDGLIRRAMTVDQYGGHHVGYDRKHEKKCHASYPSCPRNRLVCLRWASDASQTLPTHRAPKTAQNAWQCACVPNMAEKSCYLRVPKNLPTSLPWQGGILDMTCPTFTRNVNKCLKIRPSPYLVTDMTCRLSQKLPKNAWQIGCDPVMIRTCPGQGLHIVPRHALHIMPKNYREMPENQAASLLRPKHLPNMAYTPCPKNYLEMPGNHAASLLCPGHGLYTMSQKLPRNVRKDATRTLPEHGLHSLPRNCPKIPNKSSYDPALARTHPEHGLHTVF
ncbi:Hypothetical predicted protein [Olea europaea subsp. europaea]|uniref:Uncharacterized protein n=1 Tax=Olea europaea subsp. europaea TaxID=158383 RepID=A0A8S0RZP6_OLEEU|nr:Hypothetical predicted protein [Olea europaea subsp. europaea]